MEPKQIPYHLAESPEGEQRWTGPLVLSWEWAA